jgi:hypothetical protein
MDENRAVRWRLIALVAISVLVVVGITAWILRAATVNHWLAVHTGTVNEAGPYYGFWSGFGSDIAELGILGAIGTAAYHQFRKYNCHEPGCWRIGTHPAAGGKFTVCYRHHPDFDGKKPTHETIAQVHAEHVAQQSGMHSKLQEIHEHLHLHEAEAANGATS